MQICGEAFGEPSSLKLHSAMHTEDEPFECKVVPFALYEALRQLGQDESASG